MCFLFFQSLSFSLEVGADVGPLTILDDLILVQLGAAPKGLSYEDQEAYSRGLREVIRDIRARNVKDFNTVAAEITAFRTKFLGDSTKVLSL